MILAVSLTGCQKQNIDGILMSDWIRMINDQAGIVGCRQKEPYYMNIAPGDACFEAVQAAVEWGILDSAVAFSPDDLLTREWMAYTLMNLSGRTEKVSGTHAADISRSRFPDAVNSAVASGLLKTDGRNLFHPQQTADRKEAEAALKQVIAFIDHREISEPCFEAELRDDIVIRDENAENVDTESMTAQVPDAAAGDYIRVASGAGEAIYQIISEEDGVQKIAVPDAAALTGSMHVSGSAELNFEDAEIIGPQGDIITEAVSSDDASGHLHNMSLQPLTRSFSISGWQVILRASAGSIAAEAVKTLAHGETATAEVALSGLKVDYDWNHQDGSLQNAYFRAAFHTAESFAVKGTENKYLYSDFSRVDSSSFLNTISSFYQQKKDVIEGSFTLCTIKVPLPQAPGMSVSTDLKLILHASGKAEISLGQDSVCGMEVRNGSLRLIRDFSSTREALVRSDFRFTSGIRVSLNMLNMSLCDLLCEAGANGKASATVHLYDEDGRKTDAATDVDAYAADLMSSGNENVFVCADLSGSWLLDLSVNTAESSCGKLGLYGEAHILNETNAPLIKGLGGHYENWQPVPKCTYQDHQKGEEGDSLRVSSNIVIENYAVTIPIGETRTLNILAVPVGYTLSDLVFASEDSSVAVAEGADIRAVASGSTNVTVSTSDGKYRIRCSILVPQVPQ